MPFIDLASQRERIRDRIDAAVAGVLDHGRFVLGPEVATLEERLAAFSGVRHAITCSSGTDALFMVLMAWRIGPGDAVFVPSFTFASTAEAVALVGATPVFVDVEPKTFNLSVKSLAAAIEASHRDELRPRAVIPVDMFGLPANYTEIEKLSAQWGLTVLADAAQSYGAALDDARTGSLGDAATTSFFPAKPLGCYGDGGAMFTNDAELASILRSLRVHGQGSSKYDNVRVGINGRLDTIQAAVLLEKLSIFEDELQRRREVAARYTAGLNEVVGVPVVPLGVRSAWAQYTILVDDRNGVARRLAEQGVPTAIYYPKPLHQQTAYASYPGDPGGLPVAERLAREVLSLPIHPYLDEPTQDVVIAAVRSAVEGNG